jgi:hypothetical protein
MLNILSIKTIVIVLFIISIIFIFIIKNKTSEKITISGVKNLLGVSSSTLSDLVDIPTQNINIPYVPQNIIAMWSGSVSQIPIGWYLCDGNNSTPDLRGRFIVGASSFANTTIDSTDTDPTTNNQIKRINNSQEIMYDVGEKGGLDFPVMTEEQMPQHNHNGPYSNLGTITIGVAGNGVYHDLWYYETKLEHIDKGGIVNTNTNTYSVATGLDSNNSSLQITQSNKDLSLNTKPYDNRPQYYALAFIMKA